MSESKTEFRQLLEKTLNQVCIEGDAEYMKAYMKGNFEFIGVKSGPRKTALRECIGQEGLPTDSNFDGVIRDLWSSPYREVHYCAQELMDRKKWWKNPESIDLIEFLMRKNQWWDSIDYIASTLVGSYFKTH